MGSSKLMLFTNTHTLLNPFFSHKPKPKHKHQSLSFSFSPKPNTKLISNYGPSLPKPIFLDNLLLLDDSFTRVYHLAAIRVPSSHCHALESRLRGHLLNWPRIRNIARLPGDDQDDGDDHDDGAEEEEDHGGALVTLRRRIYGAAEGDGEALSPVLARDDLARKFDSTGFLRFRNLARISRPSKSKKKKKKKNVERERESPERRFAVVEVVGDDVDGGGDFKGLLGDEFVGPMKWRGSTRLLLLDERCSTKCLSELPQAVQAVMNENTASTYELVKCKLTLFYDYWQMNEILEAVLPENIIVPSSFETVGHIAHLNLKDEHFPYKKLIAKVVLDKNKPKIQTVVNKIDAIHNDYRTMELEVLAGNHSLVTTVVENGLRFGVDLSLIYWNSRLGTERQRLISGFTRDDVVCDVFCGVGPITVAAARIVKRVYANDLNRHAIEYLERNSVLNNLERKIRVFNMDGRRFIVAMFQSEKASSITQVVMNLPNNAVDFLDAFRGVFRGRTEESESRLPTIHIYGFSKARDPEFDFHERIRIGLSEAAVDVEMRRVRLVAPGKWMLCASFILPKSVAFAKPVLKM